MTVDPSGLKRMQVLAGGKGAAEPANPGPPILEISTTGMETWSRCDRRYFYRYVRGLVPKAVNFNMQWGTLWHRVAQEYYRGLQNHASEDSAMHNAQLIAERTTLIENKYHGDSELTLEVKDREALWDSWMYYYEKVACQDDWDEIVAVEEPIFLVVGVEGVPILKVRATLDLHVKKKGTRFIVDHKTTGEVQKNLAYLALDIQMRTYPLAIKTYYDESPTLCYNMISRDVPPGYRHRPLFTESGRARSPETLKSMQDVKKYLHREFIVYSDDQYRAFEVSLVKNALVLRAEQASANWPRRIVKMGGMACDGCPYFGPCTAEFDGQVVSDDNPAITMMFTKDPLVEPKRSVLLTGLPKNPFLP